MSRAIQIQIQIQASSGLLDHNSSENKAELWSVSARLDIYPVERSPVNHGLGKWIFGHFVPGKIT